MLRRHRLAGLHGLDPESLDGFFARLEAGLREDGVPAGGSQAVLAVAEELCTNILEHSGASWLELEADAGAVGVRVALRDDGRAFNVAEALERLDGPGLLARTELRHLGLFMLQQLARELRYIRLDGTVNQLEFEIPFDAGPEGIPGT